MHYDKESILKVRKKYLNFISNWPNRFVYKGKNFKELFMIDGELSQWWLCLMQKKDSEGSPVFEALCQRESGMQIKKNLLGFRTSLLYAILSRIKYFIYIFTKVLIFKLFYRNSCENKSQHILFVTLYPQHIKIQENKICERYYLQFPYRVESELGLKIKYLSFYYGSILRLLSEVRRLNEWDILLYEANLTFSDLFREFNLWALLKYVFIERKSAFRKTFDYDGKNMFDLFKSELRVSFVGPEIYELRLLIRAIERIAKKTEIRAIISFFEMYPYARALYYGAKKGNAKIKTISFQHANCNPIKLWYVYSPEEMVQKGDYIESMPIPDYFIFQGESGKKILREGGYPEERCLLTGTPRFDCLANLPKTDIKITLPSNKKIVLIATTYLADDTRAIIKMVAEVAKKRDDCCYVFKGHPSCPVEPIHREFIINNSIITSENIHQLILRADVILSSYSTTADEAISLGCPAICLNTGFAVNMGSFFEIEAAPLVNNSDELNRALDMVFSSSEDMSRFKLNWPELIRYSFYKMDGRATERVLKVLRQYV